MKVRGRRDELVRRTHNVEMSPQGNFQSGFAEAMVFASQ